MVTQCRKPVISWDFDNTLVSLKTGKIIEENFSVFQEQKNNPNVMVVITTFRGDEFKDLSDIKQTCPGVPIWATCGESKVDWLRWKKVNGWNIIRHYDDHKETIDALNRETDIQGVLIKAQECS